MGQTATIVMCDLVDSTRLRSVIGEDAADAVRREHDDRLRVAIEAHGGTVVKGLGDGLLSWFAGAAEALHGGIAMQQTITTMARKCQLPLAIRVGVSSGDVSFEAGDCFGSPVIEAARLCAAATTGEILLADLVRLLARGRGGLDFEARGAFELKGLPDPIDVFALKWAASDRTTTDLRATSPYVGRDKELLALQARFESAVGGNGALVLISGEPGMGKTRLTDEFISRTVRPANGLVLSGGCHDGDVVANAPFVEAFTRWARATPPNALARLLGNEAAVLARLAPTICEVLPDVGEPLPVPPEAEGPRLRDAVSQVLLRNAAERPVVLLLDDLHWADEVTVSTLRTVARNVRGAGVLIVGTYRETDLDRRHPFAEGLVLLQREVEPQRLALSGLDATAVQSLLEEIAEHDVVPEFAALLATETDGNPFFLRETLMYLVEDGQLKFDDGAWSLRGTLGELGIPAGVRDVVGRRLSRLSDAANRLLAVGALFEVAFPLPIAAKVAGLDESTSLDAIDAALEVRIVRATSTFDEYCFTHALFRHVLVEEQNPSRQVRAHRAIAEAIEMAVDSKPNALQASALLRHYERSSALPGAEKGVDYALLVADDAGRRYAPREEFDALEMALDLALDDDVRRLELQKRRAAVVVYTDVARDRVLQVVDEAGRAVEGSFGQHAACDFLSEIAALSSTNADTSLTWAIAALARVYLASSRRDAVFVLLRFFELSERDFHDVENPGIALDTPDWNELRTSSVMMNPAEFPVVSPMYASMREVDAGLAMLPANAEFRGIPYFPFGLLFASGRIRRLSEESRALAAHARVRGWLPSVMLGSTIEARAARVLGEHDRADASLAESFALVPRISDTSNSVFQAIAAQLLGRMVCGEIPSSVELGGLRPFLEGPNTRWAGLAVVASHAFAFAAEGRVDEAMQTFHEVLPLLDLVAGWAANYPFIVDRLVNALWVLDRDDELNVIERNLRTKIVEPDVRYPETDGRWSLALVCALDGRYDEAREWFAKARDVMRQQETFTLHVGIDLDEAIMELRASGNGSRDRARELLAGARLGAAHPAMSPWIARIETVEAQL